jgi:hypothetical protein
MFCDAHHKSLTETVAAGRELTPSLQRHLSACEPCRNALVEEQSLFAAIDAGLRCVANPEVPATLIPRVHVALNDQPASQSHSQKWIFAGATLAAVLVVTLVLKLNHGNSASPKENVAVQIPASPTLRPNESRFPNLLAAHSVARVRSRTAPVQLVSVKSESPFSAEVLVPDEERAAFAKFLTGGQSAPVATTISAAISRIPEAPKVLTPLQPVEIASLRIPSLSREDASRDEF